MTKPTEQQRRYAALVLGAFRDAFPGVPHKKFADLSPDEVIGLSDGLEHFVSAAKPEEKTPWPEKPMVLPMEGGFLMGMCATAKGTVLVWAHDDKQKPVEEFVERCFPGISRRRTVLHIIEPQGK